MKKKNYKRETRPKLNAAAWVLFAVLILYSAIMLILLIWAVMTSFKLQDDFRLNTYGLPKQFCWNYSLVFSKFAVPIETESGKKLVGMGMMYVNSFAYSLGCAFAGTLVQCITAYLCAKFPYKFSKIVYTVVIVTMILPIIGNLPSEIRMSQIFGLYDNIWGAWILRANFLGINFLIFYSVFKGIPKEFTEAAKMDGAGNVIILFRIMMPLAMNTFLTFMLINFITYWNDYQIPLIYLPSHPTVAFGMYAIGKSIDNVLNSVPMRMTGAVLLLLPILILFVIFQKRLVGNLTMGGVKG